MRGVLTAVVAAGISKPVYPAILGLLLESFEGNARVWIERLMNGSQIVQSFRREFTTCTMGGGEVAGRFGPFP